MSLASFLINQAIAGGGGSSSAGGLTNFTESVNTTAPNAATPVVRLLATNAATNADLAIAPKGESALLAQVPDNSTSGGNKRGGYSVDFQRTRNAANEVCEGYKSGILSGDRNRIVGNQSVIAGGVGNQILSPNNTTSAICGGVSNVISGTVTTGTIAAGYANGITGASYTFIGGGFDNQITGAYGTITGGGSNRAYSDKATIGGGESNVAGVSGQTTANSHATVVGGKSNTASGQYAFVGGGLSNTVSGKSSSVVGGENNVASGWYATIGGYGNTATSQSTYATIFGRNNTINNAVSHGTILGFENKLFNGSDYSTVIGVQGATIVPRCIIHSAGQFANVGDAQSGQYILRRTTTNATSGVLTVTDSVADSTNQLVLPNNATFAFEGTIVARNTANGDSRMWKVMGLAKRGASAAATSLVGSVTYTDVANDAGASGWTVAATADTTNGAIAFIVTGAAATTIRTVARINTVEVAN